MTAAAFAAVCVIVIASVLYDWHANVHDGKRPLSEDFGVFYCAGAAVNAHENPYLTRALDRCGDGPRERPAQLYPHRQPAPLPGYDVALFRLFAMLPFPAAAALWLLISSVAAFVGIIALASISAVPPVIVLLAVAVTLRESLAYGQLPPFLFAALALSAYALTNGKYVLAGVAATAALVEPHIGIPVVGAMFLWIPRARTTLAVGLAFLALVSAATLGIGENIAYFRAVLPSQVLAEVPSNSQFSLTWLLYFLGMREADSIRIGSIQYAITAIIGIVVAGVLAKRMQMQAIIVLAAAAFAIIGGPYIHSYQVQMTAILFALVIAGRTSSMLAWSSVLLLCVSWDGDSTWLTKPWSVSRFESAFIAALLCMYALRNIVINFRGTAALAVVALYFGLTSIILASSTHQTRPPEAAAAYLHENAAVRDYSTLEWGLLLRTVPQDPSREALLTKSPTWLGLVLLVWSLLRVLSNTPGRSEPVAHHPPALGRA